MGFFGGGLQKLEFIGYSKNDFSQSSKVGSFSLPINPESFNHAYKIELYTKKAQGKSAASVTFNSVGVETVDLKDIYIDGTGAVPLINENKGKTVDQLVEKLKKTVYSYSGSSHAPPFVQLVWGTFNFNCFLQSFSVEYQMFKPDGTPLRAKIDMSFKGFVSPKEESSQANRQSPDVTHIITIKHGDSLPALCYQVYNNTTYYLDVAAFNELTDFRNLKVGSRLIFPPLKQ